MRPQIIRGTTPTIKFCFKDIDVADITTAYITVKQMKKTIIEKDISSASKEDNHLVWTLSQEETLSLEPKTSAVVVCDWKLNTSLRGLSHELIADVKDPGKDEVI